ncbi:putative transposase domain protein, partial [Orientia tsutsugamushi str. TA763]
ELWAKFFDTLQEIAQKDKENGFLYIKALLHYTISKVSKNEQPRLKQLLDENLSIEDRKRIMGTIAAQYIKVSLIDSYMFTIAKPITKRSTN